MLDASIGSWDTLNSSGEIDAVEGIALARRVGAKGPPVSL